LGLPTLTIWRSKKKTAHWLPGWSYGETINPLISIRRKGHRYWKFALSVNRAKKDFDRFIMQLKNKGLL